MTRKNMPAVSRGHAEASVESLRKDPKFAVEYLNAVLQDGDEQELMVAMRRIADAMGGVPQLASKTKLNATTLYRTLSKKGNPELRSMTSMLKAWGCVSPCSRLANPVNCTMSICRLPLCSPVP